MQRGRPKSAPDQLRDIVVRSRFSQKEYSVLQDKAEKAHLTVGEYIRSSLIYSCFGCGELVDDPAPVEVWTSMANPDAVYILCAECKGNPKIAGRLADVLIAHGEDRDLVWDDRSKPTGATEWQQDMTRAAVTRRLQEGAHGYFVGRIPADALDRL